MAAAAAARTVTGAYGPLIDIGANLTDLVFRGVYRGKRKHPDDFAAVLQRARDANVGRIIVTGGSLQESRAALKLAREHEDLYCTVGVHPTRCKEFEMDPEGASAHLAALQELCREGQADGKVRLCAQGECAWLTCVPRPCPQVVAVGECGLDYDRLQFCPKAVQLPHFEEQFELAEATRLPMFLHNRNTGDDFYNIQVQSSPPPPARTSRALLARAARAARAHDPRIA